MSASVSNCIVVSICQLATGHGQQKNPAHREGDTKRANSRTCYVLWRINGTHRRASVTAAMTLSEQNQSGFITLALVERRTVSALQHLSGSLGATICQIFSATIPCSDHPLTAAGITNVASAVQVQCSAQCQSDVYLRSVAFGYKAFC